MQPTILDPENGSRRPGRRAKRWTYGMRTPEQRRTGMTGRNILNVNSDSNSAGVKTEVKQILYTELRTKVRHKFAELQFGFRKYMSHLVNT